MRERAPRSGVGLTLAMIVIGGAILLALKTFLERIPR